jgi:hypothetical protein
VKLTDVVKVTLTTRGKVVYDKWRSDHHLPFVLNAYELELPLWQVMAIFGPALNNGPELAPFLDDEVKARA